MDRVPAPGRWVWSKWYSTSLPTRTTLWFYVEFSFFFPCESSKNPQTNNFYIVVIFSYIIFLKDLDARALQWDSRICQIWTTESCTLGCLLTVQGLLFVSSHSMLLPSAENKFGCLLLCKISSLFSWISVRTQPGWRSLYPTLKKGSWIFNHFWNDFKVRSSIYFWK